MHARVRGLCARALPALFGIGLLACGGDDDSTTPIITKPPPDDGRDSGDGTEPYDAAVPWPRRDAGPSNVPPGEPEEGLVGTCAIDSNKIFIVAERAQPFLSAPLAVDALHSGFVIPYVASGSCLDAVHWASMAGDASDGAPKTTVAFDGCALVRDAAAIWVSDHWLLASIDNREAPYDLWVEPYSASAPRTAAIRISENSHVETGLALATAKGDKVVLAYAAEDLRDGQALYVRMLDAQGEPLAEPRVIEQSTTLYYQNLIVRPRHGAGALLAYVRYALDYSTSDIVLVTLDEDGRPVREPWVIASNAGPSASVAIALDGEGAGIVYGRAEASTGRHIWFQQLDDDGKAALTRDGISRAAPLRVVNSPNRGIDVSMTKLRTGFIMTYRALPKPEAEDTRAKLRVYFLDRYGQVVGSSDVSYTSSAGGRTALQSANDGRVVLSWNEVDNDGDSALKVVRLPCVGE